MITNPAYHIRIRLKKLHLWNNVRLRVLFLLIREYGYQIDPSILYTEALGIVYGTFFKPAKSYRYRLILIIIIIDPEDT